MSQNPARDRDSQYDFSRGVRGKHHEAYRRGTNVVLLDPDVAEVFKDSEAVNTALRLLLSLARDQISKK
jgi:hypothetical protein